MHSKGRGPQILNYVHRHAARAAAPCRLVLGSFFLFDRLLGLYSSLRLEGMTRISFYHTVVFLQDLFGWLVLLASINAALPVASLSSSGCREATGKYSVICAGLGLLLHHGVCKKGWKWAESGLLSVGEDITTNPAPPQWHRDTYTLLEESGTGGQQKLQNSGYRKTRHWKPSGEMLVYFLRVQIQPPRLMEKSVTQTLISQCSQFLLIFLCVIFLEY